MKKIYFILAAALACFATACTQNELTIDPEEPDTPKVTYLQASVDEVGTKSSINGTTGAFTWSTGDKIAVYYGVGGEYHYKVSEPLESTYDGKATALFTFNGSINAASIFAFFPSTIVDSNPNILKISLSSSYSLDQVAGERCPTPMQADNSTNDGILHFKQIGSMLRVKVKDIPAETQRLAFSFSNTVQVYGEFTLQWDAASEEVISLSDVSSGVKNTITVTMSGNNQSYAELDINLPLPTGAKLTDPAKGYDSLTVTAFNAVSNGDALVKVKSKIKNGIWQPARRAARKMTTTLPYFTIADGKKVVFAPGNLQWQHGDAYGSVAFDHPVNENDASKYSRTLLSTKSCGR